MIADRPDYLEGQSKLAELRAMTDQQLVSLIDNALDLGLLLAANEAEADPGGVLHRRAADIYGDSVMLVEKVENVQEQQRLEVRLKQSGESGTKAGAASRRQPALPRNLPAACRSWLYLN